MERKNSTLVFDTIFVSEQECFYLSGRARESGHMHKAGRPRLLCKEELLI